MTHPDGIIGRSVVVRYGENEPLFVAACKDVLLTLQIIVIIAALSTTVGAALLQVRAGKVIPIWGEGEVGGGERGLGQFLRSAQIEPVAAL